MKIPRPIVFPLAILAFTIMATSASAQMDFCHFRKPVHVIRPSALPAPVIDAMGKPGLSSTDITNTTAPSVYFAGKRNDFYFAWTEIGGAIKITEVSLFHLTQKNKVEVLEGGWPGFSGFAELCQITKSLLDKYTGPSQNSSPSNARDMIVARPASTPYPPISQRLYEEGTTRVAVSIGIDGAPADVAVSESSGTKRLDDAAITYVKEHYRRQTPLEVSKPAQVTVAVVWRLDEPNNDRTVTMPEADYPPGAVERGEEGDTHLEISLGDGGVIKDEQVFKSSGYADLDDKALAFMKVTPGVMAGKSTGTQFVIVRWTLPRSALPALQSKGLEILEIHATRVLTQE